MNAPAFEIHLAMQALDVVRTLPTPVVAMLFAITTMCVGGTSAATTPVYRCTESGSVLYTDAPCRHAAVVHLPADRGAAPDATERLRRDQQMLDAATTERRTRIAGEEAQRDAQRAQARPTRDGTPANEPPPDATYYGGYGYGSRYSGAWAQPPRRALARRDVRQQLRPAAVISVPPPVHRAREP